MTAYIAFVSPPELRRDSEQLVANIDARSKASQADLMTRIMANFTDEILKVFFTDMVALMDMSPFMTKVVHGAVGTIKKTVHSVSGTVIRKLDNKQLIPMSAYISSVMLTAPDADGVERPQVGFPVKDATHARLRKVIDDMRQGDARAHVHEFADVLIEITDLAVESYLRTPIELLQLGLILRKLSEGGMSVIQGAVHMVIRKLAPDLQGPQLLAVAAHLEKMILIDPKTYR